MKNLPIIAALCLAICFFSSRVHAQSSLSNLRLIKCAEPPVDLNIPGGDTLSDPMLLAEAVRYTLTFEVISWLNIDKIEIDLGSTQNSFDILHAIFEEDGVCSTPYTMQIENGKVFVDLGLNGYFPEVHVQVRFQYLDGTFSNPFLLEN